MKIRVASGCNEYIGKKIFIISKGEIKEGTFKGYEDISYHGSACYVGYIEELPYESFSYFYTTKESIIEEQNEEYRRELERFLKEKDTLEDKIKDLQRKLSKGGMV